MSKQVFAAYDDQGIFVYQAFKPSIVEAAVRRGTFDTGFNLERMTWIKPSFGWMLYRSGYATKHRQEAILKIKLSHEGFQTILRRGVATSFGSSGFATNQEWGEALGRSEVRFQWDPDRDLFLRPLDRRAIQLGLSRETVRQYVSEWIVGLEDVTSLARAVAAAAQKREGMPAVPPEHLYPLDEDLQFRLGITRPNGDRPAMEARG